MPSADVTGSIAFLTEAAAFAQRLHEHGHSVFDLRYDGLAFGNWGITGGTAKRRVIVSWDGREGELSAQAATFGDSRSRPTWRTLATERIEDRRLANLFLRAEQLIHAGSAQNTD